MMRKLRKAGWLSSSPLEGEPKCTRTPLQQTQMCERILVGGALPQTQVFEFAESSPPLNRKGDLAPPQGGSYRARTMFGVSIPVLGQMAVRFLFLGAIRLYQICLSPFMPPACRFQPSCSHYAAEAITRHGACKGGWLTIKRLARCHPFGGSGHDPVP